MLLSGSCYAMSALFLCIQVLFLFFFGFFRFVSFAFLLIIIIFNVVGLVALVDSCFFINNNRVFFSIISFFVFLWCFLSVYILLAFFMHIL